MPNECVVIRPDLCSSKSQSFSRGTAPCPGRWLKRRIRVPITVSLPNVRMSEFENRGVLSEGRDYGDKRCLLRLRVIRKRLETRLLGTQLSSYGI
jgi:hypothetical protein